MSPSRLAGSHDNSLPLIQVKRSRTNIKTLKPDLKAKSQLHKSNQNVNLTDTMPLVNHVDVDLNEKINMIKKNMLSSTFDHFAYGQLSKQNSNEQSFQLLKQPSNCDTKTPTIQTHEPRLTPTSSLADVSKVQIQSLDATKIQLQEKRTKTQIYRTDVEIVKSLGNSMNHIPNERAIVKRTKTQLCNSKNDDEFLSRSNFLNSIKSKFKKSDVAEAKDQQFAQSSRNKFDLACINNQSTVAIDRNNHPSRTNKTNANDKLKRPEQDKKKRDESKTLDKIEIATAYSNVELINTFDINQVDVTNKEIRTRIKVWLADVNKAADSGRPPSSVSWFGDRKHTKVNTLYNSIEHPNREDSILSDFNPDEEQIFKYNRILDKTFCIVYND
jgi:hypothetical protein